MRATHKVYNTDSEIVGYVVDGVFYNKYTVNRDIQHIDNLYCTKTGNIRAKHNSNMQDTTLKALQEQYYTRINTEAPIVRDVYSTFQTWFERYTKYILYVKGLRQVGKTTELLKFAYTHYEYVVYVNLADSIVLNAFKTTVMQVGSKVAQMRTFCDIMNLPPYVNSSKTLLIIDEIQVDSAVYSSLRTLRHSLNCHIAVTGSYLGVTLRQDYFQPAGDTYDVELLPLSFKEFTRVFGQSKTLENISVYGESSNSDYTKLTELYKLYLTIGGFPAVVMEYCINKDVTQCMQVIKRLLERFIAESTAYFAEGSKMRLVFDNVYKAVVLTQLTEKKGTGNDLTELITQFIKTDTKTFVTRSEVNKAVAWLVYNGVLGTCDIYVNGDVKQLQFNRRCYFTDTGVLTYLTSVVPLQGSDRSGMLAETFVYNELRRLYNTVEKQVIGDKPSCATYNDYELDFLVFAKDNKRYGIEVTSNRATSVKSLDAFQKARLIDHAVIAEITHGGSSQTHKTIPIYAVAVKFPYGLE